MQHTPPLMPNGEMLAPLPTLGGEILRRRVGMIELPEAGKLGQTRLVDSVYSLNQSNCQIGAGTYGLVFQGTSLEDNRKVRHWPTIPRCCFSSDAIVIFHHKHISFQPILAARTGVFSPGASMSSR